MQLIDVVLENTIGTTLISFEVIGEAEFVLFVGKFEEVEEFG